MAGFIVAAARLPGGRWESGSQQIPLTDRRIKLLLRDAVGRGR